VWFARNLTRPGASLYLRREPNDSLVRSAQPDATFVTDRGAIGSAAPSMTTLKEIEHCLQVAPPFCARPYSSQAEVLAPLDASPGVNLNVTVEIEATSEEFHDAKVRTVSKNAATLKFEKGGIEEGPH
jgi:hypothetical protein